MTTISPRNPALSPLPSTDKMEGHTLFKETSNQWKGKKLNYSQNSLQDQDFCDFGYKLAVNLKSDHGIFKGPCEIIIHCV